MFRRKVKELVPSFAGVTVRLASGAVVSLPWSDVSHMEKTCLHFETEAVKRHPGLPKRTWLSGRATALATRLLHRARRNVFRRLGFRVYLPVRGPWWLPLVPGFVVGGAYLGACLHYSRLPDVCVRASWDRVLKLAPPSLGPALLFFFVSGLVMVISYGAAIAWMMWVPARWRYEYRDADGLALTPGGVDILRGQNILRQYPWSSLVHTRGLFPAFSTPMGRHRLTYIWIWSKPRNGAMIRECAYVMRRRYRPPREARRHGPKDILLGGALVLWCTATVMLVARSLRDLGDDEFAARLMRTAFITMGVIIPAWVVIRWLIAHPPKVGSRWKRRLRRWFS